MKIEPHTLKTLFQEPSFRESQIQIPIYQRKYCWNTKIVKQMYEDLVFNGTSFGHHIGKLFFQKYANGHRVCIDGQQRLTTLLIGICALRDVVLEVFESGHENVLAEINSHIFIKPVNLKELQEEYLASEDKYGKASEIAKNVSRLIPSHDDRVSYIEILIGFNGNQTNILQNANMHNTRQIFHKIFKSKLVNQQVKSLASVRSSLLPILTGNGKFVIVEYDEFEINAQQRFGELYDVGKSNQILFFIKTPGIDLSYSDLIKNYLLSKLDEMKQVEIYENYWIPLERNFISDSSSHSIDELSSRKLDYYLEWYLYFCIYPEQERIQKFNERKKKIEEYERLPLSHKLGLCGKETNFTLYSQFVNEIEKSQLNVEDLLSSMIKHIELYRKE